MVNKNAPNVENKNSPFIKLAQPCSLCIKSSNPVWLPPVDSFRTFCWGKIIEELRNIYKLKELINKPAGIINPI